MAESIKKTVHILWKIWRISLCRALLVLLSFLCFTVIVGLVINLVSSWLLLPRGTDLHTTNFGPILDWTQQHELWMILLIAGLGILIVLVWRGSQHFQKADKGQSRAFPTITPEQFLQKREYLIRGLLREYQQRKADSLQGRTMMMLGLHERTDIVRASGQLVFQRLQTPEEHALPIGTSIVQAYDLGERGLLILGEPGAGKSTFLLDLASELLRRAQNNSAHPIPVILNLSSWASARLPLEKWLVEQLRLAYAIPSRLSQMFMDQRQWLLLLDGLDEMPNEARSTCIEIINTYYSQQDISLVVCSRQYEYLEQKSRLALPMAVVVQPLEPKQVLEYLKQEGKAVSVVRVALQNNSVLREIVRTPLMLNIVILTYHGKTIKDLPQIGSMQEQQRQIFDQYVERAFSRPLMNIRFAPQHMRYYLINLAKQMNRGQQTEWYIEQLQSIWLPTKQWRKRYHCLVNLLVGLYLGLALGLLFGLGVGLIFGLGVGLIFGLAVVLIVGLIVGVLNEALNWFLNTISKSRFNGVLKILVRFNGIARGLSKRSIGDENIQILEVLVWSWKNAWFGLIFGLLIGSFCGLFIWLFAGVFDGFSSAVIFTLLGRDVNGFSSAMIFMLLGGGFDGLIFALIFGLSEVQLDTNVRHGPNQRIVLTGQNALRVGLPTWLFFLLIFVTSGLLHNRLHHASLLTLLIGLFAGLFFGLIFGFFAGGEAYLKHYILRFLLWRSGALPYHLVDFFEESCERILLQRVGGGCRFIHPLLQDYFASFDSTVSKTN